MPFFILSLIIQVALVVHVLKTGRNTLWVFLLIFAPVIGTLAYVIVELLPEWTNSRTTRKGRRSLSLAINPNKHLEAAANKLAVADTVQNAITLAEESMRRARYAEAKELYERSLTGIYADDPVLLLGIAKAQFGLDDFAGVLHSLTELKEKNPDFSSAEGHLLFARSQEQLGNSTKAIEEYEALCKYYPGPEPACRLALLLKAVGEGDKASQLFDRVVSESKTSGRHYNTIYKEWVATAKRELSG
jgi:hypothetical protein